MNGNTAILDPARSWEDGARGRIISYTAATITCGFSLSSSDFQGMSRMTMNKQPNNPSKGPTFG